jgi:hypothetical protein
MVPAKCCFLDRRSVMSSAQKLILKNKATVQKDSDYKLLDYAAVLLVCTKQERLRLLQSVQRGRSIWSNFSGSGGVRTDLDFTFLQERRIIGDQIRLLRVG